METGNDDNKVNNKMPPMVVMMLKWKRYYGIQRVYKFESLDMAPKTIPYCNFMLFFPNKDLCNRDTLSACLLTPCIFYFIKVQETL